MPKILIVDDEMVIITQLEEHLTFMGYEVVGSASCGEEAISMVREFTPDIILMDIVMEPGGLDGIDAAKVIQAEQDIPVIFLTAFADDTYVERARNVQPFGYILKPFREREIKACIEIALHKKEIERQLQESEERHRSVVETAGEAIIIVDHCGSIVSWNHAAETMFGYASAEAAGQPFTRMIPEGLREKLEHEMHQIVATGKSAMFEKKVEYSGLRKDGREFPIEFSLTAWKAREDIFCTIIAADISARKQAQERIEKLNAELEQRVKERTAELMKANLALQESMDTLHNTLTQLSQAEKMAALGGLVAGITHEINTPLGVGVTAASHLQLKTAEFTEHYTTGALKRSDMETYMATAEESSGMILRNLMRASELIRSFKQVAVDQSSEAMRWFNLREYIDDILLSLRPKLKKTRHTVTLNCPEDLELTSYPGAFSQILTNFIMNSLMHGFEDKSAGQIVIDVAREDGTLHLHYSDNGKGIPAEHLTKIFDPFFTTKSEQRGSGIGLHIVYNLVTQTLGGTIECQCTPGAGTSFTIRIPV